jgi:hypothetical protein
MPYKSDAQRRFMHARHPEIAARWDAEIKAGKKKSVAKSKRIISDTELRRRKQLGANLTRLTSGIGIASLGALGVGAAAPKLARAGKLGRVTVQRAEKFQNATKNKALTAGIVSSGIGGYNGFNTAAWQSAEARRRKVNKRWTPAGPAVYEPEARRVGRSKKYQHAVDVGATAAAGGAAVSGAQTVKGLKALADPKYKRAHTLPRSAVLSTGRRGAVTAGLLGAAVAGEGIKRKMNKKTTTGSWAPYAKSAFGVVEEVSKIGEWKTIDQRERSQVRARKTMRMAGAGIGLGAAALTFGHARGGTGALKAVGTVTREGLKHPEVSTKHALQRGAKVAEHRIKTNPGGAGASIGGAGLLAGSAAVGGGAKAGHTYQQHKINERRRARFKKSDSVSAFGVDHS